VGSTGDRARWAAVGRMALDLGEPMGMRSDAELSGARIALGEQRAAGQARELTMAAALAVAAEAARRATGLSARSGTWRQAPHWPRVMPLPWQMRELTPLFPFCRRFVFAVSGASVHVIAADEHLAARNFQQTKSILALLGVTTSLTRPDAARWKIIRAPLTLR